MKTAGIIMVLAAFLSGCATLDAKTNQLRVGDSQARVLEVMGEPDKKISNNANQEGWQYCVSGVSYGKNDHKDIVFRDGKLVKVDSYPSYQTACSFNRRPIAWAQPDRESLLAGFRSACTDFGFTAGTESFAQCMLSQQQQYNSLGAASSARQMEAAKIEAENNRAAAANLQQSLDRQQQQQQFQQQQMMKTISQPAIQPTVTCQTIGNITTCR